MADIWADWSTTAASNSPAGTDTPDDLHDQLQNIKAQVKGNAADIGSLQDGTYIYAADSVGTDAYAITLAPAITAYADGQVFVFKAATANTGACTLAVNGLTATAIKKSSGAATLVALEDNDIIANQKCVVVYDSDNSCFVLLNPAQISQPRTKGWVKFVGSSAAISDSYNVSGVVRNSAGNYTISWTTDFASAHYCISMASGACTGYHSKMLDVVTMAAGSVQIKITGDSGGTVYDTVDPDFVYVAAWGDQ